MLTLALKRSRRDRECHWFDRVSLASYHRVTGEPCRCYRGENEDVHASRVCSNPENKRQHVMKPAIHVPSGIFRSIYASQDEIEKKMTKKYNQSLAPRLSLEQNIATRSSIEIRL